jgi:4-amino-4-deoxy-L-arabinose transferase-like glycosyltransferase
VVALWTVMAVTSLTKGLLGFVLPLMTIGVYCLLSSGWGDLSDYLLTGSIGARIEWLIHRNRWLINWKSPLAILIGAVIYGAPFTMATHPQGADKGLWMVWRENVVRFFHPFDHRGPIYLYVYVIFALMAPWAILLPAALTEIHTRRSIDEEPAKSDRFALVYFWATFAFFTLSGSRRSYYILPIFPAAAIIIARLLASDTLRSIWARRMMSIGYAVVAIGTVIGIGFLLPPSWILPGKLAAFPSAPAPIVFAIAWILSVAGVVYALRRYSPGRIGVSVAIVAYTMMGYIYVFAMPAADAYRGEKPFASQVVAKLNGDFSHLAYFRTEEGLFYLNPPNPVLEFERKPDLIKAIQDGGIEWVIIRRKDIDAVVEHADVIVAEPSFPWEDEDQQRNKVVLLRVRG